MEDVKMSEDWSDYKEPVRELECCVGCGRDCYGGICNRCESEYETPSTDTLEQFAGRWDFDMGLLTDDELEDLSDLVQQASREDCLAYRQEKIYEAFESVFEG